ncbi:hypothetical protein WS68_10000 [Burkholderia sp. TSV86]|nr:hypothetical protein WS68_10000 [Burkholderia sp. TSV86]
MRRACDAASQYTLGADSRRPCGAGPAESARAANAFGRAPHAAISQVSGRFFDRAGMRGGPAARSGRPPAPAQARGAQRPFRISERDVV